MRVALTAAGLLALLGAGCAGKIPEPAAAGEAQAASAAPALRPLGCTIRSAPTCELGKAPKITVAVTNQTNAAIYLVGSLDASDCKRRYPHCYFEVIGPNGKSAVQGGLRCGNMNTLREQDFVKVAAGGEFDPYQHIDSGGFFSAHQLDPGNFAAAGKYRIRFIYSTDCETIAKWGGDGRDSVAANEKLVGMFRQVPKVEIRSNEIQVTVVEPVNQGP
jgi:hypothetical protein